MIFLDWATKWKKRRAFLEVGKQDHNRCGEIIMSLGSSQMLGCWEDEEEPAEDNGKEQPGRQQENGEDVEPQKVQEKKVFQGGGIDQLCQLFG